MKKKQIRKLLILAFSIWMMFEPLAVSIVQAQGFEVPTPKKVQKDITADMDTDQFVMPKDYLDVMLTSLGKTREEIEDKSSGDAFMVLANAWNLMDGSAQEAVTFYYVIGKVLDARDALDVTVKGLKPILDILPDICGSLTLFLVRESLGSYSKVMTGFFRGAAHMVERTANVAAAMEKYGIQAIELIEKGTGTPDDINGLCEWLTKAPSGSGGAKAFETVGKVMTGIGIACEIISLCVNINNLATSETIAGGSKGAGGFTWSDTKEVIGALGSIASLVCMFLAPPAGTICGIVVLAVLLVTKALDEIGNERKDWLKAYQGSHWFLYSNDEKYKLFFDNPGAWKGTKALAWTEAEKNFGKALQGQNSSAGEAAARLKDAQDKAVKQGKLMTWYQSRPAPFSSFSPTEFKEIWRLKADYMSWKPAEEKKGFMDNFWSTVGDAVKDSIAPGGIIGSTLRKWLSKYGTEKAFEQRLKEFQKEMCYFNPDYALLWRFRKHAGVGLGAQNQDPEWIKGKMPSMVFLRIQQAPFNYLPLLEITDWTDEILRTGIFADSFLCGIKTLAALKDMMKQQNTDIEKALKDFGTKAEKLETVLELAKKEREAIQKLIDAPDKTETSATETEKKNKKELLKSLKNLKFISDADYDELLQVAEKEKTVEKAKEALELVLMDRPGALAFGAVAAIIRGIGIKQNLDKAAIYKWYGEYRKKGSDAVAKINPVFKKYLEEGKCLEIEGKNFLERIGNAIANFFGGIDPPVKDYEHYRNLYLKEAQKFGNLANSSMIQTEYIPDYSGMGMGTFVDFQKTPKELFDLLAKVNTELKAWNTLAGKAASKLTGVTVKWESGNSMYGPYEIPSGLDCTQAIELPTP